MNGAMWDVVAGVSDEQTVRSKEPSVHCGSTAVTFCEGTLPSFVPKDCNSALVLGGGGGIVMVSAMIRRISDGVSDDLEKRPSRQR